MFHVFKKNYMFIILYLCHQLLNLTITQISRDRDFDESGIFTWIYEGDKSFSHMMTTLLIMGFLFCVCFPIWPNFLKVFAWYMSVSFLLLIFFLVTFRGFLFLGVWILGYDFWFLPNLFDEQLGFIDSFKPLYSFEKTKEGQLYYRIRIVVAFSSFCWWDVTQPSKFDGFVSAQGDFIKDLYAGTLLSDVSQADKENIDKPKMDTSEDLLAKLESSDDAEEEIVKDEELLEKMMDNLMDEEEDLTDMKSNIKSEREENETTRKKQTKQDKKQTHKHTLHLSKSNL